MHARAAEPPDRPATPFEELFLGEPAFVQDAGELQVEGRVEQLHEDDEDLFSALVALELGLSDRVQLELDLPYALRIGDGENSLTNPELGALWNFRHQRDPDTMVSAGVAVELPSFGNDLGDDAWTFTSELAAYRRFGALAANLSAGPLLERRLEEGVENELQPGFDAALALLLPRAAVIPVLELESRVTDEVEWVAALGALIHPAQDWEIGAAAFSLLTDGELGYGGTLFVARDHELAP